MVANKIAENVLGTIGLQRSQPHNSVYNLPLVSGRYHTLDRATYTSDLEELLLKVHRWTIRLAGVSAVNHAPHSLSMSGGLTSTSFLWGISGPFLGVYVVVQNLNIPLILQPQIFAFLCAVSWAQVGHNQSMDLPCD